MTYDLVYQCSSPEQRLLWKRAFDAVIAHIQRFGEEE